MAQPRRTCARCLLEGRGGRPGRPTRSAGAGRQRRVRMAARASHVGRRLAPVAIDATPPNRSPPMRLFPLPARAGTVATWKASLTRPATPLRETASPATIPPAGRGAGKRDRRPCAAVPEAARDAGGGRRERVRTPEAPAAEGRRRPGRLRGWRRRRRRREQRRSIAPATTCRGERLNQVASSATSAETPVQAEREGQSLDGRDARDVRNAGQATCGQCSSPRLGPDPKLCQARQHVRGVRAPDRARSRLPPSPVFVERVASPTGRVGDRAGCLGEREHRLRRRVQHE